MCVCVQTKPPEFDFIAYIAYMRRWRVGIPAPNIILGVCERGFLFVAISTALLLSNCRCLFFHNKLSDYRRQWVRRKKNLNRLKREMVDNIESKSEIVWRRVEKKNEKGYWGVYISFIDQCPSHAILLTLMMAFGK